MHDLELISRILNDSSNAIIAFDLDGKVIFWNSSSERLFKYKADEVLGKFLPFITETSKYEIDVVIQNIKEGKQFNFKTQKRSKEGDVLDLVLFANPLCNKNKVVGVSIIVQYAEAVKNLTYIPLGVDFVDKEQKRTFEEIRKLILFTLVAGKKTINQISNASDINWRTVEKHLTYLIGKKFVEEIFSSEYVRIFELTDNGKNLVERIKKEFMQK
ncbi:MAG TPA: PAS domain S-box protein [Candidatus Nanoarchaeia archaeon]|nr:PAS domain S-box protein [Candidatus Nanoarchaeia archaeon]